MNPATAFAAVLVDELIRCGLREAVLAPGSRSAPLAIELHRRSQAGDLRLHVRVDERSAAFLALGLAKASGTPVAVACTSGTAAAHFHAAVIEADESAVPLLLLTADRPPELRGTGANQTIDQLKLYGSAVRWFTELDTPGPGPAAAAGYWRSAACRAFGIARGAAGSAAGPVHLNLPLREPLVPGTDDLARLDRALAGQELAGRPAGEPWTRFPAVAQVPAGLRGLVLCGDGDYDPAPLVRLAETAGWPVLAEPSSNARRGPNALTAYPYLLADAAFLAAHRPELIVSAGRPGLTRGQLALLRGQAAAPGSQHVVIAAGPGRWSDPARTAAVVAADVRLTGSAAPVPGWLGAWQAADRSVRSALQAVLNADPAISEPRLARDLAAGLPAGALLWAASSLPIRDLDQQLPSRPDIRVLSSRGASGIDGLVSAAIGAALAHQAAGGGPAYALLGDLALLHDAPGLFTGPEEPMPDLCLIVVNNDGGGIFSGLEQAAIPGPFERVFGTPHGASVSALAAAAGLPYYRIEQPGDLAKLLATATGLRLAELRTDRGEQNALRTRMTAAAAAALANPDRGI